MLVFKSTLQHCLQKNPLIFIPGFIWIVKTDLLLYQITNAKFNKGEKIWHLHLCFGSEPWCSFELNSPVIPTCWVLIQFTEWFHYTWTKFLQEETELDTLFQTCTKCTPTPTRDTGPGGDWHCGQLQTTWILGTFITEDQTKSSPKQSLPQRTAIADSAASAPSASVCSLLLLHVTAFQCWQAGWTVWQILGLRYSYHKSWNNMYWEVCSKSQA